MHQRYFSNALVLPFGIPERDILGILWWLPARIVKTMILDSDNMISQVVAEKPWNKPSWFIKIKLTMVKYHGHNLLLALGPDFNGEPVELTENWGYMRTTPSPRQQPGSSILHQLKYPDRLQGQIGDAMVWAARKEMVRAHHEKGGLDELPVGIKIAGGNISTLRYADDTTLMAESEEELKSLLMRVKEERAKVGLKLNIKKTKIMASGPLTSWQIDGEEMEVVSDFIFLGSKITADRDCSLEIKRHLLLGRKVMANLDSILKSRDITLPTKVCVVKAMVFPVAMYGCENWTIRKAERRSIEAFELWCWRRLLRVSWIARCDGSLCVMDYSVKGVEVHHSAACLRNVYVTITTIYILPFSYKGLKAAYIISPPPSYPHNNNPVRPPSLSKISSYLMIPSKFNTFGYTKASIGIAGSALTGHGTAQGGAWLCLLSCYYTPLIWKGEGHIHLSGKQPSEKCSQWVMSKENMDRWIDKEWRELERKVELNLNLVILRGDPLKSVGSRNKHHRSDRSQKKYSEKCLFVLIHDFQAYGNNCLQDRGLINIIEYHQETVIRFQDLFCKCWYLKACVVHEAPTETVTHEETLHLLPSAQESTPQPNAETAEPAAVSSSDPQHVEQMPGPLSETESHEKEEAASSTQKEAEQTASSSSDADLPEPETEDTIGVVDFSKANNRQRTGTEFRHLFSTDFPSFKSNF
ncbi:putative uncharacterized transposon-derived protein F52C9.6 [Varanus komodoensis]|nr:putative uncharacterized transposon-derived protein F52C9.6 [Varanus komodoensis]